MRVHTSVDSCTLPWYRNDTHTYPVKHNASPAKRTHVKSILQCSGAELLIRTFFDEIEETRAKEAQVADDWATQSTWRGRRFARRSTSSRRVSKSLMILVRKPTRRSWTRKSRATLKHQLLPQATGTYTKSFTKQALSLQANPESWELWTLG